MRKEEVDIDDLCNTHNINRAQAYMAKAMMSAGANIDRALNMLGVMANNAGVNVEASSLSCPRCNNLMQTVTLSDGRKALYCTKDRVTMPVAKNK